MAIKLLLKKYGYFEMLYMFIMVIYMAQATDETSRMVGSISGNPIPFLLPIILTIILCKKHPVSFKNRSLLSILLLYTIWAVCSLIKYGVYTTQELSYHFFMYYAIIIAFVHNQVFGYKLLPIYENILVFFCKIAIIGWLIAVLLPFTDSIFRLFPETRYGNHLLYLFNWMDPAKGQIYAGLLRNAGCSWEPGRFAIMVTLAIYCNLCQHGIKFKGNKNVWWLLIALATTQSTTGYFTALVVYLIFFIKKFNFKYFFLSALIILPVGYGLMQLDFMSKKIFTKLEEAQDISRLEESFSWNATQHEKGEYLGSIDRFDAMAFEWLNFVEDPILGYGRNTEHSYFYTHITTNFVLANGLVKILGMYGIFLGVYFFYILFISSRKLAEYSHEHRQLALFVLFCLSAISYPILSIPIFTSFWLYGLFVPLQRNNVLHGVQNRQAIKE